MNENINNNVKIGARILSENNLDKLLPTHNDIYSRINKIRKVAANKPKTNIGRMHRDVDYEMHRDVEYDRHFNNTISLLGGRGSGKTSAMLTIKYKIGTSTDFRGDIVMPIIVPEKMGDSSDVLGWTIGLIGNIIEDLEEKLYKKYEDSFINDSRFFRNCKRVERSYLSEKYKELLNYYTYTHKDYRRILLDNYDGLNNYINKSKNILSSEQELSLKFDELICEIINIKRKMNEESNIKEIEPLIFIFFDDVDLRTDRCVEILNIILRYLSNANIVTFISGNYTTFLEVITINNLRKEGLLNKEKDSCFYDDKNISLNTALYSKQLLTKDILKKAMPPALRYYFPKIKDKDKIDFTYSSENDSNKYDTLKDLIIKKLIGKDIKSENSFMDYNGESIDIYFSIFDDKPRGLMNVYYFLDSLDEDSIEIAENLRGFINVVIDSSDVLVDYREEIDKIIDIKNDLKSSFIDYQYIETMLDVILRKNSEEHIERREIYNIDKREIDNIDKREIDNIDKREIDKILKIFLLSHFIENIIVLKVKDRKTHGKNTLLRILNFSNNKKQDFILYPNVDEINLILKIHSEINKRISTNRIQDLDVESSTISIYLDILSGVSKSKNIYNLLKDTYKSDEIWTSKIVSIILTNACSDKLILNKNISSIKRDVKKIIEDYEYRETIIKELGKLSIENNEDKILNKMIEQFNSLMSENEYNSLFKFKIELNEDNYNEIFNNKNIIINLKNVADYTMDRKNLYKLKFKNIKEAYIIDNTTIDLISEINTLDNILDKNKTEYIKSVIDNNRLSENNYNQILRILNRIPIIRRNTMNSEERDFLINLRQNISKSKLSYLNHEELDNLDQIIYDFKLDLIVNTIIDIINNKNKEKIKESNDYRFILLKDKIEDKSNTEWFKYFVQSVKSQIEENNINEANIYV